MHFPRRLRRVVDQLASPDDKVVGLEVSRPVSLLLHTQTPQQSFDYLSGDFILNGEDVLHVAVEAFRPQLFAAARVDQLSVDANASRSAPCATFQQVTDAKVSSDVAHVHRPSFVGKDRISGDDEQASRS